MLGISFARANTRGALSRMTSDRRVAGASTLLVWVFAVALLAGCGGRLVPDYDRTVIDGLTKINEEAMTLFARVSPGVRAQTFPSREAAYDGLLGKLEALRLQVLSRPTPTGTALRLPGTSEKKKDETLQPAPTVTFLTSMNRIFGEMRDRDKKSGLQAPIAAIYKNQYESQMDNALTYEKALPQQGS